MDGKEEKGIFFEMGFLNVGWGGWCLGLERRGGGRIGRGFVNCDDGDR